MVDSTNCRRENEQIMKNKGSSSDPITTVGLPSNLPSPLTQKLVR